MPPHKKKTVPRKCKGCGEPFKRSYACEDLCLKCRDTLPKCASCHTVMAPEHGFMESFAREVGKYKICNSCSAELRKKGYLHISESQYLLPSGRVKVKSVQAGDKV